MKNKGLILFFILFFDPLLVLATPTINPLSIQRLNVDFQHAFKTITRAIETEINDKILENLHVDARLTEKGSSLAIYVEKIDSRNFGFIGFDSPPGIYAKEDGGIGIRIPEQGGLGVSIRNMVVRVTGPLGKLYYTVDISVSNLSFDSSFRITATDKGKVNIDNVSIPKVTASIYTKVTLNDPKYLPDISGDIETAVNRVVMSLLDLDGMAVILPAPPFLKSLIIKSDLDSEIAKAISGQALIEGDELESEPLMPIGGTAIYSNPNGNSYNENLETIIRNIDRKILEDNATNGQIYQAYSYLGGNPHIDNSSWEEDYGPAGEGNVGDKFLPHGSISDSALWTGNYLAALAYRYTALKNNSADRTETLSMINDVLYGVNKLFELYGDTGRMARVAVPRESDAGQYIDNNRFGSLKDIEIKDDVWINENGKDIEWIGHQGDGITRDQYTGIFFGLYSVFTEVDDLSTRETARDIFIKALDYIVDNNWIITEGRPPLSPTAWASTMYQKITLLTMANVVAKGTDKDKEKKYSDALEDMKILSDSAWLSSGSFSFEQIGGYYKFNLFYTYMFSYLKTDHNFAMRDKMMQGARIADYYTSHHTNAYFNIIRASYDSKNRKKYLDEAYAILNLRLKGGHRHAVPADMLLELDRVSYEEVDVPDSDNPMKIATKPVHPGIREFGDFTWQRSPYTPVFRNIPPEPGSTYIDDGKHYQGSLEQTGVELSLLYWLLRAEGYAVDPMNDEDGDGIVNGVDNCVLVANLSQANADNDELGDACDNDNDNDELTNSQEIAFNTNPLLEDSDGDLLPDICEVRYGLDPNSKDTDGDAVPDANDDLDGDKLTNKDECKYGLSLIDARDALYDTDSDKLSNYDEIITHKTNPVEFDTDGDGIPDGWEVDNELNPLDISDGSDDPDDDGASNLVEYKTGADPNNPDSDYDGILDGEEVSLGLDPIVNEKSVNFPDAYISHQGLDMGTRFADINRDGRKDIIQLYLPSISSIYGGVPQKRVFINDGANFIYDSTFSDSLADTYISFDGVDFGTRVADLDGDGDADLIQLFLPTSSSHYGGVPQRRVYINDNGRFDPSPEYSNGLPDTYFSMGGKDLGTRLVDLNNDKLPDLIQIYLPDDGQSYGGVSQLRVFLNTGKGFEDKSSAAAAFRNSLSDTFFTSSVMNMGTRVGDIDGNGFPDLIQLFRATNGYYGNQARKRVFLNDGTKFTESPSYNNSLAYESTGFNAYFVYEGTDFGTRLVDVNNDGKDDIVQLFKPGDGYYGNDPQKHIYLSTEEKRFVKHSSLSNSLPDVYFTEYPDRDLGVQFARINNDELPDLVQLHLNNVVTEPQRGIYLNNGTSFSANEEKYLEPLSDIYVTTLRTTAAYDYYPDKAVDLGTRFIDINGDGRDDAVQAFLPRAEGANHYAGVPQRRIVMFQTASQDADRDGLLDGWEIINGLNPFDDGSIDPDNGPLGDSDEDGLNNLQEYKLGTSTFSMDSDSDGIMDGEELLQGRNPAVNEMSVSLPDAYISSEGGDFGTRIVDIDNNGTLDLIQLYLPEGFGIYDGEPQKRIFINDGIQFHYDKTFSESISDTYISFDGADWGTRVVDIDGDGYQDIIQLFLPTNTTSYGGVPQRRVYLNMGGKFELNAEYSTSLPDAYFSMGGKDLGTRLVDLNNDKKPDLIQLFLPDNSAAYGGVPQRRVFLNTGTGFENTSSAAVAFNDSLSDTYFASSVMDMGTRIGDIDGNEFPDIIQLFRATNGYYGNQARKRVFLNDGTKFTESPSYNNSLAYQSTGFNAYFIYEGKDFGTRLLDVNNDGRDDIVQLFKPGNGYYGNDPQKHIYLSTQENKFERDPISDSLPNAFFTEYPGWDMGVRFAYINKDPYLDLVQLNKGANGSEERHIYLKTPVGYLESPLHSSKLQDSYISGYKQYNRDLGTKFADLNNDGSEDVIQLFLPAADGLYYGGRPQRRVYMLYRIDE